MTLDDFVGEGDPWDSNSLFSKLGKWACYASFAVASVTGISYVAGAHWAQDLRAYFDVDYAHWINCERQLVGSFERISRDFPKGHPFNGVSVDLQLALASHIYDSKLPANGGYAASYVAFNDVLAFSGLFLDKRDVSGSLISDANTLIELYESFDALPLPSVFEKSLDSALVDKTWAQAADILKVE